MFRFAHPHYIYLLGVIPILILIFVLSNIKRRKQFKNFGNKELLAQMMPEASLSRFYLKFWLLLIASVALIIVIAGPQFGSKLETVKKKGVELMVALDVSNSMMAQDVTPSRIEKSKQLLARLINQLRNDKVGLIVFAGDAFTQLPITNDVSSAKLFLSTINPGIISTQGTNIGAAINLGVRSFGPKSEAGRSIIVITDGENHEEDAVSAAKAALAKGIKTHVIGIGSPQGSPIPINRYSHAFRKDQQGNVVISKLNEDMCKQIAQAGEGIYVRADNSNRALKILKKELSKMKQAEVESKVYSEYNEQFQVLAWFALFFIVMEFFILGRKNRLLKDVKLFVGKENKKED